MECKGVIKESKEYIDILGINFETEQIFIKDKKGLCDWYEMELIEVLKNSGKKDKNGKEIISGHIVKFEDMGEEGYEYREGFDFTNMAVVAFENGRFCLTDFASDNSGMLEEIDDCYEDFFNRFKGFEIVGNIYENANILEEYKKGFELF